jgi:4-hydroxybutyrate CoA-transferase
MVLTVADAAGLWRDLIGKRLLPVDEAAALVRSGDRVAFTTGREPHALALALAARKHELHGVQIFSPSPTYDLPWFDEGWEDSFAVTVGYVFPRGAAREAFDAKRLDQSIGTVVFRTDEPAESYDVVLTEVTPPDVHGFCGFGPSVYNKAEMIRAAKLSLAEVNERLIRTYGDNWIHHSEIDYFVEHPASGRRPGQTDLLNRPRAAPSARQCAIAEHVAALIEDGDTLQIGVGSATEPLPNLGILDRRTDLGWHSEVTPPGIIRLVAGGVVTGRHKTLDTGKCTATAIGGGTVDEMAYVHMNPLFELRRIGYVNSVMTVASQQNMIAINNALSIDLTGQIASESIGPRMWSGAGGQPAFVIGALHAKHGRSVTVLPATTTDGRYSRIVPLLAEGTVVTVPRTMADIVVTEYGTAQLRGKSTRQRVEALIAIAHPDFRGELREQARRLHLRTP